MNQKLISIEEYSNEEIIKRYLDKYRDSIQSVKMRESSLKYFFVHFEYNGHISEISKNILMDYFDYLKMLKNLALTTKRNKWSILTSLLEFCMEYYDDFSVVIPKKTINWGTKNHKKPNLSKRVLATEEEIKKILDDCFDNNYKLYIIFRCLAEGGMRKGGLIDAEFQDLHVKERYLYTIEKTGDKIYYFTKDLMKHLNLYLEERKKIKTDTNALFVNRNLRRYSKRYFNLFLNGTKDKDGNIIQEGLLHKLGINKRITCHTFRKTLNTLRKKKMGLDNDNAKVLLGHKTGDVNIESYTIYNREEYLKMYDKYNPYQDISF